MVRAWLTIPRHGSSFVAQVATISLGLRNSRGDVALATAPLFV